MRQISYVSIVGILVVAILFTSSGPVKADAKTVFIYKTAFTTNKGLGFSVPVISISRVLTVKKEAKISSTALIKAADLFESNKLWKCTILTSKIDRVMKSHNSFVFSKKKILSLVINYKPTKKTVAKRILQVQVG